MNIMSPNFAKKLGLQIWQNKVGAQKNYSFCLEIFEMVIAFLEIANIANKSWFFKKIFFLPVTSMDIALRLSFLTISNIEMNFLEEKLS